MRTERAAETISDRTMTPRSTWADVDAATLPPRIYWDIAPADQGQAIEVAYGGDRMEAGDSSRAGWKRVTDRSTGTVRLYRRVRRG